jgi:class 3 adenylate cyclase
MQSMGGTEERGVEGITAEVSTLIGTAVGHDGNRNGWHGTHSAASHALPRTMAAPLIERRPLAVLLADVVGYSRLIEADDLDTALRIRSLRRHLIGPAVTAHGGRVVDAAGDGTLMAFPVAGDALRCATAIHQELEEQERSRPNCQRLRLRMGISADGEVLVVDGELYGRAVNIAARLLALAAPGEVYLSGQAVDRVDARMMSLCEPLGRRRLHNIARWVRVYRLSLTRSRNGIASTGHEAIDESETLISNLGTSGSQLQLE